MRVLIDADNLAFACAASAEDTETPSIACARASEMAEGILRDTNATEYELWLTGGDNFRYKVYPEYKANRHGAYRPKWEKEVRAFLTSSWQANTTDGIEADDMLGIRQHELSSLLSSSIIAHLDKDINQIPGWHFNWELNRLGKCVREKKQYFVTLEEGNRFFYYQLLTGDPTDNIKGAVGIGPKKAAALLDSLEEREWYNAVLDCYSCEEELDLNAQCLYIWRKHNDSWRNLISGIL
jgi:DNA polymerase-1